jgi:hypothetical protein
MAITTRKELFRSRVVGAGWDSSGNPVQGKDIVVGVLSGAYVDGGIQMAATDMGLTTVDYVMFRVTTPAVDADGAHEGAFNGSLLFIYDETSAEIGATDFVTQYIAVGDGARQVDLL